MKRHACCAIMIATLILIQYNNATDDHSQALDESAAAAIHLVVADESDAPNTSADNQAAEDKPDASKPDNTIPSDASEAAEPTKLKQEVIRGKYNPLSDSAAFVIIRKGTEARSDGGYTLTKDPGTYICRQCNAMLYLAKDKFESHCGWPSFDDEIKGAIEQHRDADGQRVEIVCANCQGHLGHVFRGERLTQKNTRHCVNSISMKFIPAGKPIPAKIISKDLSGDKTPAKTSSSKPNGEQPAAPASEELSDTKE